MRISRLITVSNLLGGSCRLWRLGLLGRIGGILVWIGRMGRVGVRIHCVVGMFNREGGLGRRRRTRRGRGNGERSVSDYIGRKLARGR